MMFEKLRALRDKLASVPAFSMNAAAQREIISAIDDLDDAMVQDIRLQTYTSTLPPFDAERFTEDFRASYFGSATVGIPS
jgi:hypothetical protein